MKNKTRFIVLFSIIFLVAGVFFSCGQDEEQAVSPPPPQDTDQGLAEREQEQPDVTAQAPQPGEQEEMAQPEPAEPGTPQTAMPQTQDGQEMAQTDQAAPQAGQMQASQEWVGKQVKSQDGQTLGTVSELYSSTTGGTNYLIVKSQEDKLHPVPADMIQQDPQGQDLVASIDQSTFQQSPSLSEAERQRLSESEFEQQVRGYYEQSAGTTGGVQPPGQQSQ